MAISIGKRKRAQDDDQSSAVSSEDESTMKLLFQKAFEAKFTPLPQVELQDEADEQNETDDVSEHGSDVDEWDGLSDDEEIIQVINHDQSQSDSQIDQAHERRVFMSSKPPSAGRITASSIKPRVEDSEEDSTEKVNLKNDLALQRLLKESHVLTPSNCNKKAAAPEGKSRLKSLDLQIQDLGAKKSMSEQQKMPLSHRKGISAKITSREDGRRKEAAENGVVLEKARLATTSAKRRERSVGGPTVGKFKGGTLKLSSRDVRSIQGPKQRDSARRKGRR